MALAFEESKRKSCVKQLSNNIVAVVIASSELNLSLKVLFSGIVNSNIGKEFVFRNVFLICSEFCDKDEFGMDVVSKILKCVAGDSEYNSDWIYLLLLLSLKENSDDRLISNCDSKSLFFICNSSWKFSNLFQNVRKKLL